MGYGGLDLLYSQYLFSGMYQVPIRALDDTLVCTTDSVRSNERKSQPVILSNSVTNKDTRYSTTLIGS